LRVIRSVIVGSGSNIPPHRVTNEMLATIMETSDAWIRERTGVEARHFADRGTSTLALSIPAARQAIESAGLEAGDIDMVVYATMTPDQYLPGNGCLLQTALGLRSIPCFDIRQQCSGFIYGLQLADAHIRAGLARTVLLVGAEVHAMFMPFREASWARLAGAVDTPLPQDEWDFNTQVRHLAVLFGDGAAAVVVQAREGDDRGVIDHLIGSDGADFDRLYVPGGGSRTRPWVNAAMLERGEQWPRMDGRYVFKMATVKMAETAQQILGRNGLAARDLALVLMHQANRRINEYVQKLLGLPETSVIHNIQKYGNTTAATIPLLWDEAVRTGRLSPGDLVLCVGFGAGMSWGATLLRA
jgi:3-oxoacyl-[acyl-carrier-protein] synthase-3